MENLSSDQINFLDKAVSFGLPANIDQARSQIMDFEGTYNIKLPLFFSSFLEKIEKFELLGTQIIEASELKENMELLEKDIKEQPASFPKNISDYILLGEEMESGSYYLPKSSEPSTDKPVFFHDWEDNSITEVSSSFELFLQDIIADTYDYINESQSAMDSEEEEYFNELKSYMEKQFPELLNT